MPVTVDETIMLSSLSTLAVPEPDAVPLQYANAAPAPRAMTVAPAATPRAFFLVMRMAGLPHVVVDDSAPAGGPPGEEIEGSRNLGAAAFETLGTRWMTP